MKNTYLLTTVAFLTFSTSAFAECRDFSGIYQNQTEILKVTQKDCEYLSVVVNRNGSVYLPIETSNANTVSNFKGQPGHEGPDSSIATVLTNDSFGRYQVFYESDSKRTVTNSDTFRLKEDGSLEENFMYVETPSGASHFTITAWKKILMPQE